MINNFTDALEEMDCCGGKYLSDIIRAHIAEQSALIAKLQAENAELRATVRPVVEALLLAIDQLLGATEQREGR